MDPSIFNLKFLLQLPMFAELKAGELDALSPYFHVKQWKAGTTLFKEGDVCHDLVFLIAGKIAIQRLNKDGKLKEIALLVAHDAFGESAFLDNSIRSSRAVALETVEGLVMGQDAMDKLSRANPHLANQLLKILNHLLAQKLRKINSEFIEIKR